MFSYNSVFSERRSMEHNSIISRGNNQQNRILAIHIFWRCVFSGGKRPLSVRLFVFRVNPVSISVVKEDVKGERKEKNKKGRKEERKKEEERKEGRMKEIKRRRKEKEEKRNKGREKDRKKGRKKEKKKGRKKERKKERKIGRRKKRRKEE